MLRLVIRELLTVAPLAAISGAAVGLVTGLFGVHLIAAVIWGVCTLFGYLRFGLGRFGAVAYLDALTGAVAGGAAVYFVGNALQ